MENCTPDFSAAWLRIGRECALRVGLEMADADDCAAELVHKMQAANAALSHSVPCAATNAYLYRCALNHALDARRHIKRRQLREASPASPTNTSGPETTVLRQAFWQIVDSLLHELTPEQKEVFLRCCRDGETSAEVAAALNKNPNAVDQMLHRARKRVLKSLAEQNLSEAILRDYIS